jgi:hypothetical protein
MPQQKIENLLLFKGTLTQDFWPVAAVSMIPLCMSQRCQWHRCAYHCCATNVFSNIFANNPTHCFLYGNMTELHTAQRCHWHRCDLQSGIIYIDVTCTAISMTPLWHAQRYQWHRCDLHSGVNDTTVTCKAVSMTMLCKYDTVPCCALGPHISEILATFKGNIYRKNIHRKIHYIYCFHTKNMGGFGHSGVNDQNRRFRSRFSSRKSNSYS